MSARSRSVALLAGLAVAVGAAAVAAAASGGSAALVDCRARQLRANGQLSGATQSLLGTLTVSNRSRHACALPPAPRRVSLFIGRQLLPTLTVRMRGSQVPSGVPARTLPGNGRVAVAVQWRNWCGTPRGTVRAALVLTIFHGETPRLPLGAVTTPSCVDAKFFSTVAVSRFLRR